MLSKFVFFKPKIKSPFFLTKIFFLILISFFVMGLYILGFVIIPSFFEPSKAVWLNNDKYFILGWLVFFYSISLEFFMNKSLKCFYFWYLGLLNLRVCFVYLFIYWFLYFLMILSSYFVNAMYVSCMFVGLLSHFFFFILLRFLYTLDELIYNKRYNKFLGYLWILLHLTTFMVTLFFYRIEAQGLHTFAWRVSLFILRSPLIKYLALKIFNSFDSK